jgi:hypothetical protein
MNAPTVDPHVLEALELTRLVTHTSARLQAFASGLLTPSVLEHEKRQANAQSQRKSADTLRNRAERLPDGEHKAELLDRADRFERRAGIIEAGQTMPRELRYPLDSLRLVAAARDALAAAAVAIDHLEPEEVSLFMSSLQAPTSDDATPFGPGAPKLDADNPAMLVRNDIGHHLAMLGGYLDENDNLRFRQFALAIAAVSSTNHTPSTTPTEEPPAPPAP